MLTNESPPIRQALQSICSACKVGGDLLCAFHESMQFSEFEHPYGFFLLYQLGVLHIRIHACKPPVCTLSDVLCIAENLRFVGGLLFIRIGRNSCISGNLLFELRPLVSDRSRSHSITTRGNFESGIKMQSRCCLNHLGYLLAPLSPC